VCVSIKRNISVQKNEGESSHKKLGFVKDAEKTEQEKR